MPGEYSLGSVSIQSPVPVGTQIVATISPLGGFYYPLSAYTFIWQYGPAPGVVAGVCLTLGGDVWTGTGASYLPTSIINNTISQNPANKYFQVIASIIADGSQFITSNWCEVIPQNNGYQAVFSTPVPTSTGFTTTITNYNLAYTWVVTVNQGSVDFDPVTGEIVVSGLTAPASATVTAQTTRNGYPPGTSSVTGYTTGATPPPPPTPEQPPFAIVDPPLPIVDPNTLALLGNLPGATNGKTFVAPSIEIDQGYKTYLCKFNMEDCTQSYAAGMFFNMDKTLTNTDDAIFVEIVKYKTAYAEYQELNGKDWRWSYGLIAYIHPSGVELSKNPEYVLGFADVTLAMDYVEYSTPTVLVENLEYDPEDPDLYSKYSKKYDKTIRLKIVHYEEDQELGNTTEQYPEVLRVFVNNVEVKNWYKPKYDINKPTVLTKEIISPSVPSSSTIPILGKPKIPGTYSDTLFGAYTSQWSQYSWVTQFYANEKYNFTYNDYSSTQGKPILSEIYATETALIDTHENYFHSSSKFLTDIALNKNSFEKSYIMQTNPAAVGLNFYDVQYTTPAATNVAIYPISYLMSYVPSDNGDDQKYTQNLIVNEDALNYSVPINTGFRAKMFIENNSPYLVFIKKEADSNITATVNLNLWTHSIVAPSDQQIIESVIDQSNAAEVIQVDSEWIQSSRSANKIIDAIAAGIDGFSKTIQVQVFGNPLIQVGDMVNFSYSLNGINNVNYIVKNVSQSYDQGLTTNLTLAKMNV